MTRKRLVLGLVVAGVLAGGAAPALATEDESYVCVLATHDRTKPGPPVVCVWLPVDRTTLGK